MYGWRKNKKNTSEERRMAVTRGRTQPQRFDSGTPVEITIKGVVNTANVNGRVVAKMVNGSYLVINSNDPGVTIKATVPPHRKVKSGQVWETSDGKWFARISRSNLPPRLTPEDLTEEKGYKTLDESSFFIKYPDAKLVFPVSQKPATLNLRMGEAGDHFPVNGNKFGATLAPASK
jgi:hypothetical protein